MRARLTMYQTTQTESRGIPTSYGIMTLEMPDGSVHRFNAISGGFGLGAAPGLNESLPDTLPMRVNGRDVQAVYMIQSGGRGTGNSDMQAGGADFFIRMSSPRGVERGVRYGDYATYGAFGIHPDGDSADQLPPTNGGAWKERDGLGDDGTNGCFGLSSADALRFQQLYFSLPPEQRPIAMYITEPPPRNPIERAVEIGRTIASFPGVEYGTPEPTNVAHGLPHGAHKQVLRDSGAYKAV